MTSCKQTQPSLQIVSVYEMGIVEMHLLTRSKHKKHFIRRPTVILQRSKYFRLQKEIIFRGIHPLLTVSRDPHTKPCLKMTRKGKIAWRLRTSVFLFPSIVSGLMAGCYARVSNIFFKEYRKSTRAWQRIMILYKKNYEEKKKCTLRKTRMRRVWIDLLI